MMGVFVQVNEDSPKGRDNPIGYVICENGCWEWVGGRTKRGNDTKAQPYGSMHVKGTRHKMILAHRWMYEQAKGPIPEGLSVDHLCRNTLCVNPDHLEAVTHRENVLRGMAPSAISFRAGTCRRGHEFTPENTYIRRDGGGRVCRECFRIRNRKYAASNREWGMTKIATLRSVQKLGILLLENAPLSELEPELARVVDGISQLRDPTTVLPFPIRPEVCLSEVGETGGSDE